MSAKARGPQARQPNDFSMKGFYVYCIRPRVGDANKINAKVGGLEGSIRTIAFRDIEAVASEVDAAQFNEKEITHKLRRDTKWTEKNVRRHHTIIAGFAKESTVLPMKFATVFKTKKSLEAMLKKYYRKFKSVLDWLKDKQEWGLKVYLDRKKFTTQLQKKDKGLRRFQERKATMSEGMAWYMDRKMGEIIDQKLDDEIEAYLASIVDKIKLPAEKIIINNLLPQALTGEDEEMVLNSACLVKKEKAESFKNAGAKLFTELFPSGFSFEITGPWPPYNFVQIRNEQKQRASK